MEGDDDDDDDDRAWTSVPPVSAVDGDSLSLSLYRPFFLTFCCLFSFFIEAFSFLFIIKEKERRSDQTIKEKEIKGLI